MFSHELHSLASLGKGEKTGCASVVVHICGPLIRGYDPMLGCTHIDIASLHHVSAVRRQSRARKEGCQLRDFDRLAFLLVLGESARGAAEQPCVPVHQSHGSGMCVNGTLAGVALFRARSTENRQPGVAESHREDDYHER